MKSLAVIYLIGTSEENDQTQNRFKQTVTESNAIKDNDSGEAGRVHRQPTHHPDGIMVEYCGVQDRSRHHPDSIPTDDGGLQDPLNMDDRRTKNSYGGPHDY